MFLSGCNLRCPWCHNSELVLGEADSKVTLPQAMAHLRKRRQVLGGVVLSGGEPCLWDGLFDLIKEIKRLSLPVKLDTNGMFPEILEKLICNEETRPDFIAMDLKLAPERYIELIPSGGKPANPAEALIRSSTLIRSSGIAHEFRTLCLPEKYIAEKDLAALSHLALDSPWHIRPFRGGNCLDSTWDSLQVSEEEEKSMAELMANLVKFPPPFQE